jgi:hypothetical protein
MPQASVPLSVAVWVPDRTVNQGDSRSLADKWGMSADLRQRRSTLAISHRAFDFHDEKT